MRSKILISAVAGTLLAAGGPAFAATKTTTFNVSASVAANCLVTASNLTFDPYDGSAAINNSAPISVRCTNGTGYTLALSAGGGTFAQRLLSNGSNTLQYNLYTAAGGPTIWGDGTASTGTVSDTGAGMSSGAAKTHTVYGVLANSTANQNAPVGSYSDTITVTIAY